MRGQFLHRHPQNVGRLLDHPNFELQRHDITFPLYVEVDEIFNLACPASPIHYQFDPVQTTKTSVHGAINMLGLAKRAEGARSCRHPRARSMATRVHPQREDYWGNVNPIGLRACYDEGKRCAETLFFDYCRQHASRSRSPASSIPTVLGCTRMTAASCPTSSCRRCTGEPITVYRRRIPDAVLLLCRRT